MQWLYIPVLILALGGFVLIFMRDWVWSIDSRSDKFKRDESGQPIRTTAWDRAHLTQGVVMVVVAMVLAGVIYFLM